MRDGALSNQKPRAWHPDAGSRSIAKSVVYASSRLRSSSAQIPSRGLAGSSVGNNVKRDLLSLVEAVHPGAFDRADVHEDILAAVIWLDESEALLAVEPLHGSFRHIALSFSRE